MKRFIIADTHFGHENIIKYENRPVSNAKEMNDATTIWGLNESTLRKAISYGKLKNGIDVCKYGKKWVVSIEAMNREYGRPN